MYSGVARPRTRSSIARITCARLALVDHLICARHFAKLQINYYIYYIVLIVRTRICSHFKCALVLLLLTHYESVHLSHHRIFLDWVRELIKTIKILLRIFLTRYPGESFDQITHQITSDGNCGTFQFPTEWRAIGLF